MALHLTDMEELIARVVSSEARDYMSESLRCYHSGAFRACVVLSYIALFDDLRRKLAPLAIVNSTAKTIHELIDAKARHQEIFESLLADQLASANLIDAGQKTRLDIIIELRNKAAHPSGIHSSAEEARYVFFETIDKFLSRPQLGTTEAVDAMLLALQQGNFFPTSRVQDFRDIVSSEISQLNTQALPYLIQKLVSLYESGEEKKKRPAIQFFLGLAALQRADVQAELRRRIIIGKGQSLEYADLIVSVLNVDPKLAGNLEPIQKDRVIVLLNSMVTRGPQTSNLVNLANSVRWLLNFTNAFGQESIWLDYQAVVTAIIGKNWRDTELMKIIAKEGPIHRAYFEELERRAGSGEFDTANSASNTIETLDSIIGSSVPPLTAFRLLTAVSKAAGYGAWGAESLYDDKFNQVSALKAQAASFISNSEQKARDIIQEIGLSKSFEDLQNILQSSCREAPQDPGIHVDR